MTHAASLKRAGGGTAPTEERHVPNQPSNWRPQIVQLAARLALWPREDVRRDAVAIYRRRPPLSEEELNSALGTLIAHAVRDCAQELAEGIGADVDELLRFMHPRSELAELSGTLGRLRCLDRVWGGNALQSLEARERIELRWPGNLEPALVQAGAVWLDGQPVEPFSRARLPAGGLLVMEAGSSVLLRNSILLGLMEAAESAGILIGLQQGVREEPLRVQAAAGTITLEGRGARIQDRKVKLTASEAKVLHLLARSQGAVVPRSELAKALNVQSPTGVERVIVNLRNKFGDGVIGTIYGVGYLLE